jgi:hypothetical protein
MKQWQLAQLNIGRLVAPVGHSLVADFMAAIDQVNATAEASAGFVWRLRTPAGNATEVAWNDDPQMIVNISVWESVEALREFTYRNQIHGQVLRRRSEWFEKLPHAYGVLWWVPAGHEPDVAEAKQRLHSLIDNGPTAEAFWFPQCFPPPH